MSPLYIDNALLNLVSIFNFLVGFDFYAEELLLYIVVIFYKRSVPFPIQNVFFLISLRGESICFLNKNLSK